MLAGHSILRGAISVDLMSMSDGEGESLLGWEEEEEGLLTSNE